MKRIAPKIARILALSALALALLALAGRLWWNAQRDSLPRLGRFEDNAWVMDKVGLKEWTPLEAIAPVAVAAVLESEDDRFFTHKGVDKAEAWRALRQDLLALRYKRGASTLTMQVARNVYLSCEKTLARKAKELMLTQRLETAYDKRRILEVYLNVAQWGPRKERGIGAASRIYFGVPPSALGPKEGAFLAMLLPSPVRYSESLADRRLTRYARRRVRTLLEALCRDGLLTEAERDAELARPLAFEAPALPPAPAPAVTRTSPTATALP